VLSHHGISVLSENNNLFSACSRQIQRVFRHCFGLTSSLSTSGASPFQCSIHFNLLLKFISKTFKIFSLGHSFIKGYMAKTRWAIKGPSGLWLFHMDLFSLHFSCLFRMKTTLVVGAFSIFTLMCSPVLSCSKIIQRFKKHSYLLTIYIGSKHLALVASTLPSRYVGQYFVSSFSRGCSVSTSIQDVSQDARDY